MKSQTKLMLVLVIIAAAARVFVHYDSDPIVSLDTPSYELVADCIRSLDFSTYDGERTPVYPVFMLLCGMNYFTIMLVQSVLGVVTCLLLFALALRHTHNERLAFLVALTHALAVNQILIEGAVMAEALTTVLVVGSIFQCDRLIQTSEQRAASYALLGVVTAVIGLTKPFLQILPAVYFSFLFLRRRRDGLMRRAKLYGIIAFSCAAALPILGWSTFNYSTVGHFGPSTMLGYALVGHTGAFIESAPEEYSEIKKTFLPAREAHTARTGHPAQTIWGIRKTLMEQTGLSHAELSRVLTRMSVGLILQHPLRYAGSAFQAWTNFWHVSKWGIQARYRGLRDEIVRTICRIEKYTLAGVNFLFLTLPFLWIARRKVNDECSSSLQMLIVATVLSVSLAQALVAYGESPRYSLPFQPLICFAVITCTYRLWVDYGRRHLRKVPEGTSRQESRSAG
ncbi:MAG: glycosyltransferase family 39 protein [Desulfomonilaceae bacterium]|nr:glycosyltransferase family 39 protein [Desulfomonilaceae bacterium]